MTALLFPSTNLTGDGSRLFIWKLFSNGFPGTWIFGSYQTRVSNIFLKKNSVLCSFDYSECRRKKNVILLSVGTNAHHDSKIRYLSNDSFRSSTTFIRKDDRFGVSLNKLASRWKQTVFMVVVGKCCTRAWGFGSFQLRVFKYFH